MASSPLAAPQPPTRNEVPLRITEVAAEAALGEFHGLRKGGNPVLGFAGVLIGSALPLILLLVFLATTGVEAGRAGARLGGAGMGLLLVGAVVSVAKLARGFTDVYLFRHGLIRSKNRRLHVVPWQHAREIKLWRAGGKLIAGTLLGYYVMERDGRKVLIGAKLKDGHDEFGETLQHLAAAAGVPVVEGGPAVGELRPK